MKIKAIIFSIIALHCTVLLPMNHPLLQAIQESNIVQVKEKLEEFFPNFFFEAANYTPLGLACAIGDMEIIELLLNARASIDFQLMDESNQPSNLTALTIAALHGHLDVCKLLLERGANTNPQNPHKMSPLHAAAQKGNPEIVKLLIQHGAELNVYDSSGHAPLHDAILKNQYGAFVQLLIAGANPDIQTIHYDEKLKKNVFDKTPLMFAIMQNRKKAFAHALLLHDASREIPDRNNHVPWNVVGYQAPFETIKK